ncbi:MAG: peptidoglycan DD-metalloendopeptidase family protein [Pseudomonadota bacterium]
MKTILHLAVVCLLLSPTVLVAAEQPANADASKKELATIEASINKVKKEVAALGRQRSKLSTEVQSSERAIGDLQRQATSLNEQIAAERDSQVLLQQQAKKLEDQRKQQQGELGQYLRAAWISGNQEYLKLLLNQQDPAESARIVRYYEYFSASRSERIAEFNQLLLQLANTSNELSASAERMAQQQIDLQTQQATLADKQAERQKLLANLDDDLSGQNQQLNNLEQQRVETQLLLEELRQAASQRDSAKPATPFASRKGRLTWPVEGRVSHSFGSRYELGDLTYEGVMLDAKAGTKVTAVHPGRVVFADWFGNSGQLLIIDHGDGYMSLYAHNQELYKPAGAWVEAGDVIAAVGNTGGQSATGLYFEIRHDGKAENPVNWCIARK